MTFVTKITPGLIALGLLGWNLGCNGADLDMTVRAAPQILPDTTLPDDDDSWKQQLPQVKKSGTGKAFHEGVATASEPIVAQAAAMVLANGGNAIDAAVTAMFMLNVAEPQSSGIGGGGFVLLHLAGSSETVALNCRESAPAAMVADVFVDQPAPLRSSSGASVGVPGTVRCAATLLDSWGTISLAEALEPAIDAATNGIVVSSRLANNVLLPKLSIETGPGDSPFDVAREVFHPNGVPLEAGDLLVQPDLAQTFEQIAEFGPDAFYLCGHEAGIAEAIIETQLVNRLGNHPDGVGTMDCEDLESYAVEILEPVSQSYRGYEVFGMPPPSSGGIAVSQILGMLEQFPIGDDDAGFGFGDFATLNVMLEAMRLAFADRALWVGDDDCPTCLDVPVTGLLADAYLAERAAMINIGDRLTGITAGDPFPFDTDFADENQLANPSFTADTTGDTTHVTITDRDGNIVSLTLSIEATWGTGLMVPMFGFLLNNQLTDFNQIPTANPDPMAFNPGANDPAPFKQPRSSMAPTIVLLDGEPVAAYGSPGGATIINTVVNMTLNLIDHRLTLQESVAAPRISITNASDAGIAEREQPGFELVIPELQVLGYQFNQVPVAPIGAVQAIITIPESGKQYGAADARRGGGARAADKL